MDIRFIRRQAQFSKMFTFTRFHALQDTHESDRPRLGWDESEDSFSTPARRAFSIHTVGKSATRSTVDMYTNRSW